MADAAAIREEFQSLTTYHVGTSGWHYDDWRGRFYPEKLARTKWLEYYASQFATVELNNTFYRLPAEATFERWQATVPADFVFSVKASRYITHIKRLRDTSEPLGTFLSLARLLGDRLGPVLYQLPPQMKRDEDTLDRFVRQLPSGLIHVFEFRDPSWFESGVYSILEKGRCCLCLFDMPGFTTPLRTTSECVYFRFHGTESKYGGSYSDQRLSEWSRKIRDVSAGAKDAYIYFNNDARANAVANAFTLRRLLA